MSAEENKAVIRKLFEAMNDQNLDDLDELVAEDVINHSAVAEHQRGIEGFRHVVEWGLAMSPDARYDELLGIIAEGDMVACRVRVSGTMQGEMFGVPPTGKRFSAEHVHWHRMKDGKLAERWAVRDDLGTLIQLGIIDPPGRFEADKPD